LNRRLLSPWLTIRVQFVLAAIFVVAGVSKIADPPGFAHEIYNYRLLPGALVNAMALSLPWLEVALGVALFLGVARRTAAGLVGLLLTAFIVALAINLARSHPIDCGCFGVSKVQKSDAERLDEMRWAIGRDAGMLLLVAQVLAASRRDRTG
jgi:uncharacterized membrane protein YphA (DoxX/SURF4 family)